MESGDLAAPDLSDGKAGATSLPQETLPPNQLLGPAAEDIAARYADGPLVWMTTTLADGHPVFPRWETGIYARHWLLRTWWTLRDAHDFSDRDEAEALVEAVYAPADSAAAAQLRAPPAQPERGVWDGSWRTFCCSEKAGCCSNIGSMRGPLTLDPMSSRIGTSCVTPL